VTRIALAQLSPKFADVKANISKTLDFAQKAIDNKAQIIVFPELFLTGYTLQDLALPLSIELESPLLDPIREISKKIAVVTSFPRLGEDGIPKISSVFFHDGKILAHYDKTNLPTHGMFDELRYFGKGDSLKSFDSPFGKIGLLVCRDIWHPELSFVYSVQGAKIIIASSAIPARNLSKDGFKISNSLERTVANSAFCNQVFFVSCNMVGIEDGVSFIGNSRVCAPNGSTILELPELDEALGFVDIDLKDIAKARMKMSLVRERRTDLVKKELEDA